MKNLIIEETKYTPQIEMLVDKRAINFKGKSYPENTFDFYMPVMNWLKEYFQDTNKELTTIEFDISYFNSSSSKLFFDIFDILEEAHSEAYLLKIDWFFDEDNENAQEAGEDFQEDFDTLNINLIKK